MVKKSIFVGCFIAAMVSFTVLPVRGQDWIEETGNVLQILLPASAGVAALVQKDWEGSKEFAWSFGTSSLTTLGLKAIYGKLRPNGIGHDSWPSGHTTVAFAGASFIYSRYGRIFGIPAYVLAGFTGYSRVHADKHFADDVLAGASISLLSNWYHVTPASKRVDMQILGNGSGFNIALTYRLGALDGLSNDANFSDGLNHGGNVRYRFAFGPAYVRDNRFLALGNRENRAALRDFEMTDDPTTTSSVLVTWQVNQRTMTGISLWPFESRDNARLADASLLGGALLPAGTMIRAAYRLYDLRFVYRYELAGDDRWAVQVGADASLRWTSIDFSDTSGQLKEGDSDFAALPLAGIAFSCEITSVLRPEIRAAGIYLSDNKVLDAGGLIRVQFDRYWDGTVGYQFYGQEIRDEGILTRVNYDILYLAIGHTF